jgi:hypothetical protein
MSNQQYYQQGPPQGYNQGYPQYPQQVSAPHHRDSWQLLINSITI